MHLSNVKSFFAVLQIPLGFSFANALGLQLPTSLTGQVNATLSTPAAFKVVMSSDDAHPIDPTAFYMNGIELLYRLSTYDLSQTWSRTYINLEGYGLEISLDPSSPSHPAMTTQHMVWGLLYVAFSMAVDGKYNPLTAVFKWHGQPVGSMRVNVTAQGVQDGGLQNATNPNLSVVLPSNIPMPLQSATWPENDGENLQITYAYTVEAIAKYDIFLTAMRALGDGIQLGRNNIAPTLLTLGIRNCLWVLTSEIGANHEFLLRYRHSILAVRQVISQMVHDGKFSGILVHIIVNGVPTGRGGFSKNPSLGTLGDQ